MQSTNNNRKDNNKEYDIRVEGKKLTDTAFDSIVEMLKKVFYPEQSWNHAQPVIDA